MLGDTICEDGVGWSPGDWTEEDFEELGLNARDEDPDVERRT